MSEVQLRQTYRYKIYNYRPSWILRWGVTFFFLFLLVIVIVSGFIKFPDVVPATAEITTINPPAHLVSKINGKIETVLVSECQYVVDGSDLVLLESQSSFEDIQKVKSLLAFIDNIHSGGNYSSLPPPGDFETDLNLGELQGVYSDLMLSYAEFFQFHNFLFYEEKVKALQNKQDFQSEYVNQLTDKQRLLDEQFELSLNKYERDSLMFLKGGISQSELEKSRQYILQFKTSFADLQMNLINSRATINQLASDLELTKLEYLEQKQRVSTRLRQNIQLFKAQIETWEKTYILKSPVDGIVSLTTFWSKNQNVKAGEVVLSVVPKDSLQIKVRIQFPIQNSGKVKVGQRVNIKLENYPYQEFGMLVGYLESISQAPNDLLYSADVSLENGLETSYHRKLPKVQQLMGAGEIQTDDVSLLMRFFNPLKSVFEERF